MKCRLIIGLLLMFLTMAAMAQNEFKKSFIRLGLSVSPNIHYSHITGNDLNTWEEDWNEHSRSAFGYNAGIIVNLQTSSSFEFQMGMEYSQRNFRQEDVPVLWYNQEGEIDGLAETKTKSEYLDVPVGVNYFVINRKLRLSLRGGLILSFFLDSHYDYYAEYEDGTTFQTENKRSNSRNDFAKMGYYVGLGLEAVDFGGCVLRFEPGLRSYISLEGNGNASSVSLGGQVSLIRKLR